MQEKCRGKNRLPVDVVRSDACQVRLLALFLSVCGRRDVRAAYNVFTGNCRHFSDDLIDRVKDADKLWREVLTMFENDKIKDDLFI